jgi:hypothetical protein
VDDQEEALDYLEEQDRVADALARARAVPTSADPETRAALALLSPGQLHRLTRIYRGNSLPPEHHLSLVRLLATARAEALRDDELVEQARAPTTAVVDVLAGALARDVIDALVEYGKLPRVQLLVPTADRGARELVSVKPGAFIALIGGTGAGKTSLALEMARCHARWTGPVAFFGLELDVEESAARLVGQVEMVRWLDAAELDRDRLEVALDIPRLYLFGRGLTIDQMRDRMAAIQARHTGESVLAVIDYAQILSDDITERLAFAGVIERCRRLVKEQRVVGILTSQSSRAGSVALRTGEKLGKATEDTGAESAQLERAAYVTLAIGSHGDDDGHGWCTMDLSVGKSRMGAGDLVVPMRYHGASGRFEALGEAEKAKDVRERRATDKEVKDRRAVEERAEQRVIDFLALQTEPVYRRIVEEDIGGKRELTRGAIRRLISAGHVVEVGNGKRRNYSPPICLVANRPQAAPSGPASGPQEGAHSRGEAARTPLGGRAARRLSEMGAVSGEETGPLEHEPWEPSPVHVAYAHTHGVDLAPLVAALHAGPPVRDPDAALMAALVRAHGSPGAPQRGFLGFCGPRPRGKP